MTTRTKLMFSQLSICLFVICTSEILANETPLPAISLRKLSPPPQIDGLLTDQCWTEANQVSDFQIYKEGGTAKALTKGWIGYDEKNLYIGLEALEPNPDKMVRNVKNHDGSLSHDDDVELFISPRSDGKVYYHILINPDNTVADKRCLGGNTKEARYHQYDWDAEMHSAVKVGKDRWTVEVAIPWHNFSQDISSNGNLWRINLCRGKRSAPTEFSSWSFTKERFHDYTRFAKVVIPAMTFTDYTALVITDAKITGYEIKDKNFYYIIAGQIHNYDDRARSVIIEGTDLPTGMAGQSANVKVTVPPGGDNLFQLAVPIAKLGMRRAILKLKDPAMDTYVYSICFGDKAFPRLMSAYLNLNYYTREKQADLIVSLNIPGAGKNFNIEMAIFADNNCIQRKNVTMREPDRTVVPVTLASLPVGDYQIVVKVRNENGWVLAEDKLRLRKLPPAAPPVKEVKIDHDRMIALVDGEPFFPLGIFRVPMEYMSEVANAGFNTALFWGYYGKEDSWKIMKATKTDDEKEKFISEYLAAAVKAGLMVVEPPGRFSDDNPFKTRNHADFAQKHHQYVNQRLPLITSVMKQYPNFLAYYGFDEPFEPQYPQCLEFFEKMQELDPYHPVVLLFCGFIRDWPDTFDIVALDTYGISQLLPVAHYYQEVRRAAQLAESYNRPFWHVPMLEAAGASTRPITASEQRIQTYLSVIAGARGLFWFVWPAKHRANWAELCKLTSELNVLTPVLIEKTPRFVTHISPPEMKDTIPVLIKNHHGTCYIITANTSTEPINAKFSLPISYKGKIEIMFNSRSLKLENNAFSDRYDGLAVRVYKLQGTWPKHGVLKLDLAPDPVIAASTAEVDQFSETGRKNLLQNPGFENKEGWHFSDSQRSRPAVAESVKHSAHSGKECAVIRRNMSGGYGTFTGKKVTLEPNTFYRFGSYALAETSGEAEARIFLTSEEPAGKYVENLTAITIQPRTVSWVNYTTEFKTKDRPMKVSPVCQLRSGPGLAKFDDFFLYKESAAKSRNLLNNSSFETCTASGWPDEWMPVYFTPQFNYIDAKDARWGIDTKKSAHGRQSLRMNRSNEKMVWARQHQRGFSQLRKGDHYTLSLYMKADQPGLQVCMAVTGLCSQNIKLSTEFKRYILSGNVKTPYPPSIFVSLLDAGTVWIDAVQLEKGTEATPYQE